MAVRTALGCPANLCTNACHFLLPLRATAGKLGGMDWIPAIALATLIVGLFAWMRADIAALRKEMRNEISLLREEMDKKIAGVRGEIAVLKGEVAKLRERMARMEGLLDGLREAVAGKQAA